jgi:hypothetical protein
VQAQLDHRNQLVKDYIHQTFFDPYSVMDLNVGIPLPYESFIRFGIIYRRSDWAGTFVLTFTCNAKNRFGAYTGLQKHASCFAMARSTCG